jgi:hypothetical protein
MKTSSLIQGGLIGSLAAMIVGHMRAENLDWTRDPISTFAAHAPLDEWISVSMILLAFAIFLIGLEVSLRPKARSDIVAGLIPCLAGACAAGLLVLATFEETISWTISSQDPTQEQVRIQAFHDCGLLLFFFGSLVTLVLLGVLGFKGAEGGQRYLRILPAAFAIAAWLTGSWAPFPSNAFGLKQRVSLLLLWAGFACYAFLAPRKSRTAAPVAGDHHTTNMQSP